MNEPMTPQTPQTPQLPQSAALQEASATDLASITEVFSRDPEGYQQQDRLLVIAGLHAQRLKWEALEASGQTRKERTKVDSAGPASGTQTASKGLDEMGL